MKRLLLAAVLALVSALPAYAQVDHAQVVAVCGTVPTTYPTGVPQPLTMDPNGNFCVNTAGGGGGSVTQGTSPWVVSGNGTAGTAATGVLSVQGIASMTKLLVTPDSVALPANQSVNVSQINAVTPLMGNGVTGTGSQRVTIASDNTAFSVNAAQTTSPWIVGGGGTAGTAATGVVTVQGIASMTKLLVTPDSVALPANQSVNVAQVAGTNTVNGGLAGSISVGGTVATNNAITDNPVNLGAQAVSSENTAVAGTRKVQLIADLVGKLINQPYANKENMVRGTTTATDTGAHTIIASAGGSLKNYITGVQCYRTDTGTGAIVLTFSDSVSTVMILPAAGANFAGSGAIQSNLVPLVTAAATAFTVTSGTSTSTVYCNAQGYTGT